MADNTRTLQDEDGDFTDWIELHNPAATPVDLKGWRLTDDPALPAKWYTALALPGSRLPETGVSYVMVPPRARSTRRNAKGPVWSPLASTVSSYFPATRSIAGEVPPICAESELARLRPAITTPRGPVRLQLKLVVGV